jgi:hypothetical protein
MGDRKLIHILDDQRGKLHCDACGYDLPQPLPFGPNLIGYPCPRCQVNMLTARDYADSIRFQLVIAWINKWFGWLGTTHKQAMYKASQYPDSHYHARNHDGEYTVFRGHDAHRGERSRWAEEQQ